MEPGALGLSAFQGFVLACERCSLHGKFRFQLQRVLSLCLNGPAKDIF